MSSRRNQGTDRVARAGCVALALASCALACTWQEIKNQAAVDHVRIGEQAMERENYDAALREFNEAITLNPQLGTAYARIGDVHHHQGNIQTAATYY
ncbi:MAG: tetratricopeptide repeat protein, partial [Phycisphaerae bacterium]